MLQEKKEQEKEKQYQKEANEQLQQFIQETTRIPQSENNNPEVMKKLQHSIQPWTEKYRPLTLNEMIGQKESVETMRSLILGPKKTFPHLILSGPPGTGKTTSILAAVKELYGLNSMTMNGNSVSTCNMILEINASDERGIEMVREKISTFVESRTVSFTHSAKNNDVFLPKLIVMDEADHLTKMAQHALRPLMEQFAETARFCFLVNYENKIHEAILSRCLRLRFSPLLKADVLEMLERVCSKENVLCKREALEAIFHVSKGDLRQALNILQSCAMQMLQTKSDVPLMLEADRVYRTTGKPSLEDTRSLLTTCLQTKTDSSIGDLMTKIVEHIDKFGISFQSLLDELSFVIIEFASSYKLLGFVNEKAMATFLLQLDMAHRRVRLVTDPGRMKIHMYNLAAQMYRVSRSTF